MSSSDWADKVGKIFVANLHPSRPAGGWTAEQMMMLMKEEGHAAGVPLGEGTTSTVLVAADGTGAIRYDCRHGWFHPVDGNGDALPWRGLTMEEILDKAPVGDGRGLWFQRVLGMEPHLYRIYVRAINQVMRTATPSTGGWWDPYWNGVGGEMWLAPIVVAALHMSHSTGTSIVDEVVDWVEETCGPWGDRERTRFEAAVMAAKTIYECLVEMKWYGAEHEAP